MAMSLGAVGLSYSYIPGTLALRDVTMSLEESGTTFILGGNGSGKTTLIQCLCGIRAPKSGSVQIDGRDLRTLHPLQRARTIGFVPQIHEPVFTYSVYQIVLMGRAPYLGPFSSPQKVDHERVAAALEVLDLWKLRDRSYTAISGGEQRLALIARGLAQGAKYLLMDEPDAHLDPRHQHDVFNRIGDLAAEGFTFAISSHNPNNAILYGDTAVLLSAGRLIAQGSPQEVVTPESLQHAYGMEFETLTDANGLRAVLPVTGRHPQS